MAARPFLVHVADLVGRPGAHRRERVSGSLGGLRVVDASVPPDAEVLVDTLLEWVSDGVLATGTASAPWVGECRRCLGPVAGDLSVGFRELFSPSVEEGDGYPFRGEQIDLGPLARETLLLELPLAPLCADDCQGLCPTCGADLNEGQCQCAPEDVDPRWAALDVLRGDLGE
ncbi:MAG TPA: DUF177 domain-containing protein [Acidimicrobiales bacterium]|nr:DUF177 domain-containing protein [Acidimicrobiales bacterium]